MAGPTLDDKLKIAHKYFLNASTMCDAFKRSAVEWQRKSPTEYDPQTWVYMTLWYGCLCVIAEAWERLKREEKVADPEIDAHLESPNYPLLKDLRNDVFHITNWRYFNDKTMNFVSSKDSVTWVTDLHEALSKYFLKWIEERKQAEGRRS